MFCFKIQKTNRFKQLWKYNNRATGKHEHAQGSYLLLGSKNDIHEVHVLASTVLCCFYDLTDEIQALCLKSRNTTKALITLDRSELTNILDFISCPTKREKVSLRIIEKDPWSASLSLMEIFNYHQSLLTPCEYLNVKGLRNLQNTSNPLVAV